MSPSDRYHPNNLDSEGKWIYDVPAIIKGVGEVFEPCCAAPLLSAALNDTTNSRQAMDESTAYPDPTIASRAHKHPYFDQRAHLNPKALPFFSPTNDTDGELQQEKKQERRVQAEQKAREVIDDTEKVRPSRAVVRASKSISKSLRRRSSAEHPALHRPPPPQYLDKTRRLAPDLQQQLSKSSLTSNAQPISVLEWTEDNTNAYHVGVGDVQMRMPRDDACDSSGTTADGSVDASSSKIEEAFPCPIEDCNSEHLPFMRMGDLAKHMKSHQSNDQLPHKCEVCGHCFRYPRELVRHSLKHEPNQDGLVKFQCPHCLRMFGRKDNCVRHLRNTHHSEEPPVVLAGLITPPRTITTATTTTPTFNPDEFPPLPLPPTPPSSVGRR